MLLDADHRRGVDFQLVLLGHSIARDDAIEDVLLKAAATLRQFAAIVVRIVGPGQDDAIIDHLAVGGADQEGNLFTVAEAGDQRGNRLVIVVEDDLVARIDVFNMDPRGSGEARPWPENPRRGDQRVLGREREVKCENCDHPGQHAGEGNDAAAIEGMIDGHLQQVGCRTVFHGAKNHGCDILLVRTQQKKVDQAVLERRAALLDRLRREDRADAISQRRHNKSPDEVPAATIQRAKSPSRARKPSPWLKTHWSSMATARKKISDAAASCIRLEARSTSRTCRRVCSSRFWMKSSYLPWFGALSAGGRVEMVPLAMMGLQLRLSAVPTPL